MSSRAWNIISIISLIIMLVAGILIYLDRNPTAFSATAPTKQVAKARPVVNMEKHPVVEKQMAAVVSKTKTDGNATAKPEKTLTAKEIKRLKKLWEGCNKLNASKRLKGCNALIKSKLESGEGLILAYTNRASAYGEKEKYKSAIQDYSFVIKRDPQNFEAYISRGDVLQISNKFDKAIEDYSKAISLKKSDYNAYLSRAWAYYQMDKVNAGILDLDKAIKINKTSSELFAARGQFFETVGLNKKAAKDYRASLKLDPGLVEAKDGLKRTAKGNSLAANKKKK